MMTSLQVFWWGSVRCRWSWSCVTPWGVRPATPRWCLSGWWPRGSRRSSPTSQGVGEGWATGGRYVKLLHSAHLGYLRILLLFTSSPSLHIIGGYDPNKKCCCFFFTLRIKYLSISDCSYVVFFSLNMYTCKFHSIWVKQFVVGEM